MYPKLVLSTAIVFPGSYSLVVLLKSEELLGQCEATVLGNAYASTVEKQGQC